MSDQEMNIAIAEACGWQVHPDERWIVIPPNYPNSVQPFGGEYRLIPDYCNDLNAMHEAEGILTNEQIEVYCSLLQKPQWGIWWAISATARQRAEAFLRTLGKWKGEA